MAKKNQKMWVRVPSKLPKPKVPEAEKQLVLQRI